MGTIYQLAEVVLEFACKQRFACKHFGLVCFFFIYHKDEKIKMGENLKYCRLDGKCILLIMYTELKVVILLNSA